MANGELTLRTDFSTVAQSYRPQFSRPNMLQIARARFILVSEGYVKRKGVVSSHC
jgi:hypothetical protein